jgi:hypothetical protein
MTSDAPLPNLSEPLLPPAPASSQKQPDEADCESQSHSLSSTVESTSSRVVLSDEADAAAGGIDPSASSQRQTKMNGFVLAIILFFNASGMSLIGLLTLSIILSTSFFLF